MTRNSLQLSSTKALPDTRMKPLGALPPPLPGFGLVPGDAGGSTAAGDGEGLLACGKGGGEACLQQQLQNEQQKSQQAANHSNRKGMHANGCCRPLSWSPSQSP